MIEFLMSAKANMSEYLGLPFTLNISYLSNIKTLCENSPLLLWNKIKTDVLYTPGHTVDSITFRIDDYVFSGDSLIPGIKTVYRKKSGGDPVVIENSINKIYNTFSENNILLPGHGSEIKLNESKQVNLFDSLNYHSGFCKI
jgi:glyoxylase-like metal-dependent hydrolase (beta-lactamase superfamily II)